MENNEKSPVTAVHVKYTGVLPGDASLKKVKSKAINNVDRSKSEEDEGKSDSEPTKKDDEGKSDSESAKDDEGKSDSELVSETDEKETKDDRPNSPQENEGDTATKEVDDVECGTLKLFRFLMSYFFKIGILFLPTETKAKETKWDTLFQGLYQEIITSRDFSVVRHFYSLIFLFFLIFSPLFLVLF